MEATFDAILFDFDGVLADTEPVHFLCWREVLEPVGIDLTWERYESDCIGVSDRAMLEALGRLKNPPVSLDLLWPLYPRKKEIFRAKVRERNPITAEMKTSIQSLAEIRLAVVTSSGRAEVEPILAASGLLPLFGTVVYGEDVKRLKPAPDPYLLAAERLEAINPLVLEDSEPGLASAAAAGFVSMRVTKSADVPGLLAATFGVGN